MNVATSFGPTSPLSAVMIGVGGTQFAVLTSTTLAIVCVELPNRLKLADRVYRAAEPKLIFNVVPVVPPEVVYDDGEIVQPMKVTPVGNVDETLYVAIVPAVNSDGPEIGASRLMRIGVVGLAKI